MARTVALWHVERFSRLVYIVSDIAIGIAYFAIPVLLWRILNKRKDIPFTGVLLLFISLIMLCGTTHFMDATIFWWPAYRLSALLRFATAFTSVFTVYSLYKITPLIYSLRTQAQLEYEIEERKKAEQETRQQQILKQAAEELMAKKDEFMSIASHELKTPTTTVKASLQYLERLILANENLQPIAPIVERASKQVNKLTSIINDLMDVTKIQEGKMELSIGNFNVLEMVNDCVGQCRPVQDQHEVKIDGAPDLMIAADRNRLEQVLCNLLTNAIKYSPNNGMIGISFEKNANSYIKISVTDHGIGIPADKIDHIFDRFYRVDNTSQYFQGVGLGLFISSEIVKQHGGQIGVSSTVGQGSVFWFELPA